MATSIKADSFFQVFIKDFADDFGIQNPEKLETQKREIIPEALEIDTVVSFPGDFDFTALQDRIFPFWGKENVVEYKAINDKLAPMHIYKYSWAELGILATYLLSKKRKDRTDREPLSQKASTEQWNRLTAQGAQHSCCNTILSTTDPIGVRKGCGFEPVDTYDHLAGALYRRIIGEDEFAGSVASYLVILNKLPVHPKNAPLLLLSTGEKQAEFCEWLLETDEEISLQRKQRYLLYLTGYNLVKNREVLRNMWNKIDPETNNDLFVIELMAERRGNDNVAFMQEISKRLFKTDSPIEVAQAALQADSPMGVAQAALQVDSPEEVVIKFIQNDEQMERLFELTRQWNLERSKE